MDAVQLYTHNPLLLVVVFLTLVPVASAGFGGGECTFNTKGTIVLYPPTVHKRAV